MIKRIGSQFQGLLLGLNLSGSPSLFDTFQRDANLWPWWKVEVGHEVVSGDEACGGERNRLTRAGEIKRIGSHFQGLLLGLNLSRSSSLFDTLYLCLADYLGAKGPNLVHEEWRNHARMIGHILHIGTSEPVSLTTARRPS